MRPFNLLSMFLSAVSFLTIIPLKSRQVDIEKIRKSVIFFPFVGIFEGIVCIVLANFLIQFFSSNLVSVFCLFSLFLIRGIFHIDGVSDTADALFFKGTGDNKKDIEKRLEIMKDSTVGTAGVVAIVLDVFFKFVLVKELIDYDKFLMPFLLTFCLSRWILIPLMYHGKPAKQTGLGALFVGKIGIKELFLGSILPLGLIGYFTIKEKLIFLPVLIVFLYFIAIVLKQVFEKKFNGLTGDHLGATVEISEVILLFLFVILNRCVMGE